MISKQLSAPQPLFNIFNTFNTLKASTVKNSVCKLFNLKPFSVALIGILIILSSGSALAIPAPAAHLEEVGMKVAFGISYDTEEQLARLGNLPDNLRNIFEKDSEPVVRRITLIIHTPELKTEKEVWATMNSVEQKSLALLAKKGVPENLVSVVYAGSSFAEKCSPKDRACHNNNKAIEVIVDYTRLEFRRWPNEDFPLPPARPAPVPLFSVPELPVIPN